MNSDKLIDLLASLSPRKRDQLIDLLSSARPPAPVPLPAVSEGPAFPPTIPELVQKKSRSFGPGSHPAFTNPAEIRAIHEKWLATEGRIRLSDFIQTHYPHYRYGLIQGVLCGKAKIYQAIRQEYSDFYAKPGSVGIKDPTAPDPEPSDCREVKSFQQLPVFALK
jgi:hypothetical protein